MSVRCVTFFARASPLSDLYDGGECCYFHTALEDTYNDICMMVATAATSIRVYIEAAVYVCILLYCCYFYVSCVYVDVAAVHIQGHLYDI